MKPINGGQSALAFINDYTARNTGAWLSIADFLARQNLREVLAARAAAAGKRSAAAADRAQALPVGNHGENLGQSSQQAQA